MMMHSWRWCLQRRRPSLALRRRARLRQPRQCAVRQRSSSASFDDDGPKKEHGHGRTVKELVDQAQSLLNVDKSLDQWYSVKPETLEAHSPDLAALVREEYDGSLAAALHIAYPRHAWYEWKFSGGAPRSYWQSTVNQRAFFTWALSVLAAQRASAPATEEFVVKKRRRAMATQPAAATPTVPTGNQTPTLELWYHIDGSEVVELGGYALLKNYYRGSLGWALMAVFPEHPWQPWRFRETPKGIWTDLKTQVQFFDWVSSQLNFESLENWYNVSAQEVYSLGGRGLLNNHYEGSLTKALKEVYPHHPWEEWRFKQVSRRYWDSLDNQREYFDWLGKKLGLRNKTDWYSVKTVDVDQHGGSGLLQAKYRHSLALALTTVYTDHNWEIWRFSPRGSGHSHADAEEELATAAKTSSSSSAVK